AVLGAIAALLGTAEEIKVISQRPGCVCLTISLSEDDAEKLIRAVAAGALREYDVVHAMKAASTIAAENEVLRSDESRDDPSGARWVPLVSLEGSATFFDVLARELAEGIERDSRCVAFIQEDLLPSFDVASAGSRRLQILRGDYSADEHGSDSLHFGD